ncbi:MAG: response regulator transcription factor [Gammaproteobacteria bacterium]|nr:response regulator transcription factor [Gammaproteobacteria bacterium]
MTPTIETAPDPTVFIVDDEEAVADSISMLLRSVGLATRVFPDALTFLNDYRPEQPGCLLLDVRMPRMSGLELQQELNRRHMTLPVIFITGHGGVPMAVEAMRAGALDFLQKPFNDDELIRRVQKALEQDARERELLHAREELRRRWEELTPREREIAQRLVDGQANKVVALELDISERTVELHRARIMQKMGARGLAQLVQMVLGLTGRGDPRHT